MRMFDRISNVTCWETTNLCFLFLDFRHYILMFLGTFFSKMCGRISSSAWPTTFRSQCVQVSFYWIFKIDLPYLFRWRGIWIGFTRAGTRSIGSWALYTPEEKCACYLSHWQVPRQFPSLSWQAIENRIRNLHVCRKIARWSLVVERATFEQDWVSYLLIFVCLLNVTNLIRVNFRSTKSNLESQRKANTTMLDELKALQSEVDTLAGRFNKEVCS